MVLECPALQAPSHMLRVFPDVLGPLLDAVRRRSLGVRLGDPSGLQTELRRAYPSLCQPRTDGALLSICQTQSGFRHIEAPSPTHSVLQRTRVCALHVLA